MPAKNKNLTTLSDVEQLALYSLPDFDAFQRAEYFAMTPDELALVHKRRGLPEQMLCLLQLGYFKAKQAFFSCAFHDVPKEDIEFLLTRFFPGKQPPTHPVRPAERYAQRHDILKMFAYRPWSDAYLPTLMQRAAQLAVRDVTPAFILVELLAFLRAEKIVRPGYTTLQEVISNTLSAERRRLGTLVEQALNDDAKQALQQLLVRDETLSELAAIKQDAKHFGYTMMALERQKRASLEPLYQVAKALLPTLAISQQNLHYYASLAHYYTIYDLRRLKAGQTYLYLLCYAWLRYRQLNDNLVDALGYHMKKLEDHTKERAEKQFAQALLSRQQEAPRVGRLLLLYVDNTFADAMAFGKVRQHAFSIMPHEALAAAGKRMSEKTASQIALRWQAVDQAAGQLRKNLRPIYMALELSSATADSPWLAALAWMKQVFARKQTLASRPVGEWPEESIPDRLRSHLLILDQNGEAIGLRANRYEFWIYRQLRKRFDAGELYLDDSLRYRHLGDELVAPDQQADALQKLDIPWLRQSIDHTLDPLFAELDQLWRAFNRDLQQGKLKHLDYDAATKQITWRKPKADKEETLQASFYGDLPPRDIADIFRFVNERCGFLSALTPLQPRYAKKVVDADSLMAVIIAQAMNHGNLRMAETCDIPYHVLNATHEQYLRLATLKQANDAISNFIAGLAIFPHYSFDLEALYGSVDGQKFASASPTAKARYSRKYFGRGKGVVAYTFLCNHVPVQGDMIGANEHESQFVFDICYNNTSDIAPTVITGDMHSINKANFAILYWFGMKLEPRFTNLQAQLKHLYCSVDPAQYEKFLIQPVGQIDRELIVSEKANIDQIVATLGLKEMTQSTLIRKLCTYSENNRTRRAIFEFDKLIRSIYTLRYLRDPQLQRNVHRSQNRIEAYHQLRSVITQIGGKKELIGKTDLDVAVSDQCGRLIANVVIAYNSMMLSMLLDRYQAEGNQTVLDMLRKISPVAWQHIHFTGHYAFRAYKNPIDLELLLAGVRLEGPASVRPPARQGRFKPPPASAQTRHPGPPPRT